MSDEKKPTPPSSGGGSCAPGKKLPCESESNEARIVKVGNNPNTHSATVITSVEVSNLVTTTDLPAGFTDVSNDPDNFNIQIYDGGESGPTIAKTRTVVEMFKPGATPTAFNPPRKLEVELGKVAGKDHLYRSRYLRLVVDDKDQAAKPDQTILADWDPTDPTVEILGQVMRVTYTAADGTTKTSEATVGGPQRSWFRVAVHVLRATPGGAPVVTVDQAKTRVLKWYRRVYAQISMAPQLMEAREIDPLENLVSISNDKGLNATGGATSSIKFRIRAQKAGVADVTQDIGPITPNAGDTPLATANRLTGLISAPFTVRTVANPPTLDAAQGSADLIITDNNGGRVVIENEESKDASQKISVGRVNATTLKGWAEPEVPGDPDPDNWVVGSIQQRTVLQNFDTGDDRIDVVVCGELSSGDRGQAMMPGTIYAADKKAISRITMSAFCSKRTMDGTDNHPFSSPHECGHDLIDHIHALADSTQLMKGGTSSVNKVDGTKRFSDAAISFGAPAANIAQEATIRAKATSVLGPFP